MALNIKNPEVEHLAEELARISGVSKTEAIRQALQASKERASALTPGVSVTYGDREARLRSFLELRVWPTVPPGASRRWSRDEEDALPGYGESGEPV
jgi:antitoxin VapB